MLRAERSDPNVATPACFGRGGSKITGMSASPCPGLPRSLPGLSWKIGCSFSAAAPNPRPAGASLLTLQSRAAPSGVSGQLRVTAPRTPCASFGQTAAISASVGERTQLGGVIPSMSNRIGILTVPPSTATPSSVTGFIRNSADSFNAASPNPPSGGLSPSTVQSLSVPRAVTWHETVARPELIPPFG